MLGLLTSLWGRFAGYVAVVAAVFSALIGLRYAVRRKAKAEVEVEMQRRTLDRIEVADEIQNDVARTSDGDILDKLRDNGWLR